MAKGPVRIGIVGLGGLGLNLLRHLRAQEGATVVWAATRSPEKVALLPELQGIPLSSLTDNPLPPADWVLVSVPDPQIPIVAEWLQTIQGQAIESALITHTAGNEPLTALAPLPEAQCSAMWPVQSFVPQFSPVWAEVPLVMEAEPETQARLLEYSRLLSPNAFFMNLADRQQLHIAAVFTSNFVNWMMAGAQAIAPAVTEGKYALLGPLLRETVARLASIAPRQNQTGPARRGDTQRIAKHLEWLQANKPEWAKIYEVISNDILTHYQ